VRYVSRLALVREFSAAGVEVVYFPYTAHTSSTQLRRELNAVHDAPANARAGTA